MRPLVNIFWPVVHSCFVCLWIKSLTVVKKCRSENKIRFKNRDSLLKEFRTYRNNYGSLFLPNVNFLNSFRPYFHITERTTVADPTRPRHLLKKVSILTTSRVIIIGFVLIHGACSNSAYLGLFANTAGSSCPALCDNLSGCRKGVDTVTPTDTDHRNDGQGRQR